MDFRIQSPSDDDDTDRPTDTDTDTIPDNWGRSDD